LANAHRLDFETTGVLLLAKDKPALVHLANQFGGAKPQKTYVALVPGNPEQDEFEVDLKLMQDPRLPGMMRWSKDGKKALTRFRVLERFSGVTLLSCHPETGRTHQIRVHMAYKGTPCLADAVYGGGPPSRAVREAMAIAGLERQALHASVLGFEHPITGKALRFETPPPADMTNLMAQLRRPD
jgi:RluA family pseudouridine synthase